MPCTAMKSSSLTSAGCDSRAEITQPLGNPHRCTCQCPRPVLAGPIRSMAVGCRSHTPLPGWHDAELRGLCTGELFGRGSTRAKRQFAALAHRRMGVPSPDYADLRRELITSRNAAARSPAG